MSKSKSKNRIKIKLKTEPQVRKPGLLRHGTLLLFLLIVILTRGTVPLVLKLTKEQKEDTKKPNKSTESTETTAITDETTAETTNEITDETTNEITDETTGETTGELTDETTQETTTTQPAAVTNPAASREGAIAALVVSSVSLLALTGLAIYTKVTSGPKHFYLLSFAPHIAIASILFMAASVYSTVTGKGKVFVTVTAVLFSLVTAYVALRVGLASASTAAKHFLENTAFVKVTEGDREMQMSISEYLEYVNNNVLQANVQVTENGKKVTKTKPWGQFLQDLKDETLKDSQDLKDEFLKDSQHLVDDSLLQLDAFKVDTIKSLDILIEDTLNQTKALEEKAISDLSAIEEKAFKDLEAAKPGFMKWM